MEGQKVGIFFVVFWGEFRESRRIEEITIYFWNFLTFTDIERGALILSEKPQIQASSESLIKSRQKGQLAEWIQRLLKSFNQMNKVDQLEFMSLYYVEGVKKSE